MTTNKAKVSITLSSDLLAKIDRTSARQGATRSTLIERWLRLADRHEATRALDDATAAYYESLTPAESEDEISLTRSLSAAAKRLRIDDRPYRARRRGPSR